MTETWTTNHGDRVTIFPSNRLLRPRFAWRWNVRAANNEIVEGGEGYSRRIDAVEAALRHHPRVES